MIYMRKPARCYLLGIPCSTVYMRARALYPRTSPARSRLPASQFSGESGAASLISARMACSECASERGQASRLCVCRTIAAEVSGRVQCHTDGKSLRSIRQVSRQCKSGTCLACAVQSPCWAPGCLQDVQADLSCLHSAHIFCSAPKDRQMPSLNGTMATHSWSYQCRC